MAKLTGPLMSFGARGKLGGSLVYSAWKGVSTVRQLVTPANPQTAAQTAQRDLMALVVSVWRNTDLKLIIRTAWDKLAQLTGRPISGFNAFVSQLVKLAAEDPDASIVTNVTSFKVGNVSLALANIDDMAAGDETGDFSIAYGAAPDQLLYETETPIVGGAIGFEPSASGFEAGKTIFVAVRKAGTGTTVYDRSGILAIPLTL